MTIVKLIQLLICLELKTSNSNFFFSLGGIENFMSGIRVARRSESLIFTVHVQETTYMPLKQSTFKISDGVAISELRKISSVGRQYHSTDSSVAQPVDFIAFTVLQVHVKGGNKIVFCTRQIWKTCVSQTLTSYLQFLSKHQIWFQQWKSAFCTLSMTGSSATV